MLARDPRIVAFGEDLGKLGGVNQGFAGLQTKYGALRVSMSAYASRRSSGGPSGWRCAVCGPSPKFNYLDYMLYALQILSDDLATVLWRSAGGQSAGHRAHTWPPTGRNLARRIADGRHYQPRARYACPRAARHDAKPLASTTHCSIQTEPGMVVEALERISTQRTTTGQHR